MAVKNEWLLVQLNWRRRWHPTPVLLPGKSHGRRSLKGCSPWGCLRVGHDRATSLSLFPFMHWRIKWQPNQCSCLENPRDGGAWWAVVCPITESDTTEADLAAAAVQLNATGLIQQRHLEFYPFVKLCKSKGTVAFIPSMQMLTQWKGQIIIFIIIQYIKIALILWTIESVSGSQEFVNCT